MSKVGSRTSSRFAPLGVLATLSLLAPSALLGCGGGGPEKPAAAPATPTASVVVAAKEEPPDLSPVAAPAELFAIGRFKDPKVAIETVGAWANFPFKLESVLPSDMQGLGPVVAWDAPVELAVALDPLGEGKVPEPLTVLSVGLTSLDAALQFAKAQGESVRKLRPGVYRVGDSDDISCAVGLAVGAAPARLVCGHRAHDVDGLFNYATRGLSKEPLQNLDFQLELRLDPLKKKYGAELGSARLFGGFLLREVQMDNPRFDRALSDVAYGLIDETLAFVQDLDKVRLDANVDSAKNVVNLRFETKFVGQQSWLAQAMAETVPMSAPAPDNYWQLPADVGEATYSVGWKPGRLKPLGRSLGELLDAYLDAEKVPAALRAQSSKALEGMFDLNTATVHAVGGLTEFPSEPLTAAGYRFFGWQLFEINGDSKPTLSVFDGLTAALGGRDLARILKQHTQIDEKIWPKFSAHAVSVHGYKPGAKAYRVDLPRALFEKLAEKQNASLPELSAALAAGKGKAAVKSVPLTFVVATDGDRTFVASSPDEKAVIKRLEGLKDPKAATLRTRTGLEALKSPHSGAGFVTLRRFANQFGLAGSDSANVLNALPQHGDTPIPFVIDSSTDGPRATVTFSVPRAAIGDLGTLAPVLALAVGKSAGALGSP